MNKSSKQWLIRGGSFAVAALLLYLALRGVDIAGVRKAFAQANYWWLLPIVAITLLSHWLRAMRWVLFLEASPGKEADTEDGSPQHVNRSKVSTVNAFLSLMVGYMANYAGPRLGEIIRTGNVARKERMHFSTVLGTVVVERALDMASFGIFLLSVPFIFSARIADLGSLLLEPIISWLAAQSFFSIALGATVLVLGALGSLVFLIRGVRDPSSRIGSLFCHFRNGFLSIFHTSKPVQIIVQTVAIWFCYGLMAYLPFVLLGQNSSFEISFIDAWGLMLIGAIGVIIPSPGGIGTYHFITIQSLALLFTMPQAEAASYALLTHTGQMLLYIIVGFAAMLFLGATFSLQNGGDLESTENPASAQRQ